MKVAAPGPDHDGGRALALVVVVAVVWNLAANLWLPRLLYVPGAAVAAALAGVVFCWLRLRSGSLLAPALVHWAVNGLGYTLAFVVLRPG